MFVSENLFIPVKYLIISNTTKAETIDVVVERAGIILPDNNCIVTVSDSSIL